MMFEAETALLAAVRTRMVKELGLKEHEVDIEIDDLAPAIAADRYFAISPGGVQAGKHAANGDKIHHYVLSVRIACMLRIGNVARDRRRHILMDRIRGINKELSRVSRLLRFDYGTLAIANDELAAQGIVGRFEKPLYPGSADAKPRVVTGDPYDASPRSNGQGDPIVAMVRGMTLQGAEFIGREVAI